MSEDMIARLRRKIVIVSLAAVFASLAALVLAINYVNYLQTNASLRIAMDEIANNQDADHKDKQKGDAQARQDAGTAEGGQEKDAPEDGQGKGASEDGQAVAGREGDQMMHGGRDSARTQYASRFFGVLVDADGNMKVWAKGNSELANDEAAALAQRVLASGKQEGLLDDYKFLVEDVTEGQGDAKMQNAGAGSLEEAFDAQTRVLFLDCTTELEAMRQLLGVSLAVAGCAFVVASLFVVRFSRLAVMPFEESARKQKQFIADASHELKTPLSVIATNMDILEADLVDQPEEQEWIDSTNRQVDNMRRLVGDLITLSKMEEQEAELIPTEVLLSEVAHECLYTFGPMAAAQGKVLVPTIEEGVSIKGDEPAIRQLMTILIENAIKYATGDTIEVEVAWEAHHAVFATCNEWEHDVEPRELNSLFDRFVRGERSRDRSGGNAGYGLGLSIARAIAERNGARLEVSEDDSGRIVFRVTFARR